MHIDDFQKVSERTPLLADLKPSGRFVAADMHRAGGIALLVKRLLQGKFLREDDAHGQRQDIVRRRLRARWKPRARK